MPKRTNPFQHLIALIEQTTKTVGTSVTESKGLKDKITGDLREVDIVIESSISDHSFIIGIECSGGNNPRAATVEWVEQMFGKHSTLPTNKLILVAKGGITKGARKKASFWGIEWLSLEDAEKLNWGAVIRKATNIKIEGFLLPYITQATLIIDEEVMKMNGHDIDLKTPVLIGKDGQQIDAFAMINNFITNSEFVELLKKDAFTDTSTKFEFDYIPEEELGVLGISGISHPLRGIKVEGKCKKINEEVNLSQSTYKDIAIAHGNFQQFDNDLQFLVTEREGNNPVFTFSALRKKKMK